VSAGLPRRILIGLDFDSEGALTVGSHSALTQGLALARVASASLTLFHANAADEFWDPESGRFVYVEAVSREQVEGALQTVVESVRAETLPLRVAHSEERADRAIIREVLDEHIDLVVVGRHSRCAAHTRPVGSVSRRLLHHCPALVWVAKDGDAELPRAVMVGCDLSGASDRVLAVGLAVARSADAALHLVHAFQLPFAIQHQGGDAVVHFEREAAAGSQRAIEKALEQLGGYSAASVHVGCTSPAAALLEAERRFEIDLTVMGTASRGGLPGLILGNTAERLIDRLTGSILAVKPADFLCALGR
jgi:universal stress protein E